MIRLRKAEAFRYEGFLSYQILYDYASGRANRYTLLLPNVEDPVTIGRELDLKTVRYLIRTYETAAKRILKGGYWGGHDQIKQVVKWVTMPDRCEVDLD